MSPQSRGLSETTRCSPLNAQEPVPSNPPLVVETSCPTIVKQVCLPGFDKHQRGQPNSTRRQQAHNIHPVNSARNSAAPGNRANVARLINKKGCARKERAHHTNLWFMTTLRHNQAHVDSVGAIPVRLLSCVVRHHVIHSKVSILQRLSKKDEGRPCTRHHDQSPQ